MAVSEAPAELLTLPEVQALLKLSRASVYRLIDSGELRRVKVLAGARVPADSVADYIQRCTDGSAKAIA